MRAMLFAVLVASAVSVHAQPYRSTDKSGRTQYSDTPSSNAKPIESRVGTVSSGPGASGAKSTAAQEQAFRKRQLEQEEARGKQAKADQLAKERADACQNARSRLNASIAGGRQVRFTEKGERVFMDDAEIEKERRRAEHDVKNFCH